MHRYASASAVKWHRYGLPYVTLQIKEASACAAMITAGQYLTFVRTTSPTPTKTKAYEHANASENAIDNSS
jgi:hypothetical protein